jgi:hypothetical protein
MSAHSGDERLGPYRLRKQLGAGGMGVVYLASDAAGDPVAVKVLRQGVPAEATARRRLAREVATMKLVHSPYVAEVVDADVEADPPYIVTRYVPGRTLDDVIAAGGPLTGPALASLARGLAAALLAVHSAGVVHRDLKPGNVMLVDGQPVVIDFGIAQAADSTRLTMTGMFMGTPGFMAPEIIEGQPSGPAADVHSWAATVAYAATGRPPYGTGQFEAIFYRIVHGEPDLAGLPAALVPLVLPALARNPAARPSAADLARLADGLNAAALVPGPLGFAPIGHPAGALPAAGLPAAGLPAAGLAGAGLAGAGLAAAAADQPVTRTALDLPNAGPVVARPAAAGLAAAAPAPPPAAWPATRPIAVPPRDNFADLLTPVRYAPSAAGPGAAAAALAPAGQLAGAPGWSAGAGPVPTGPSAPGTAPPQAGPVSGTTASSVSGPARALLVLATVAALVAISVLLPVAGTVAALSALVLLRAADVTTSWLTRRRSRQGARPSDPASAIAFYPLAVCRSALALLMLAPLALVCAAAVGVMTVLATGASSASDLPTAVSYAAGAGVACYCLGPGSRRCRRPLSQFYGRVTSTMPAGILGTLGLAAIAAVVVAAALSLTPGYWPAEHLGNRLQSASLTHPSFHHLSGNVLNDGSQLVHWLGHL